MSNDGHVTDVRRLIHQRPDLFDREAMRQCVSLLFQNLESPKSSSIDYSTASRNSFTRSASRKHLPGLVLLTLLLGEYLLDHLCGFALFRAVSRVFFFSLTVWKDYPALQDQGLARPAVLL